MDEKLCKKCGGELTFYGDGRHRCAGCRREHYKEHADFFRQKDRERYRKDTRKKEANKRSYLKRIDSIRERARIKRRENRDFYKQLYRTPKFRHSVLRRFLRKEKQSSADLLWRLNFYFALIQDNVCHYCLGPLSETGCGLDRVLNDAGHTCYNVVSCCDRCNTIKGRDLSYEEMMLLVPVLRGIRLKRISEQNDPSSGERVTPACRS